MKKIIKHIRNYEQNGRDITIGKPFIRYVRTIYYMSELIRERDGALFWDGMPLQGESFEEISQELTALAKFFLMQKSYKVKNDKYLLDCLSPYEQIDPIFYNQLQDENFKAHFQPACAKKVTITPVPLHAPHPKFSPLQVHESLVSLVAYMDGKYTDFNYPMCLGFCAKWGLSLNHLTGRRYEAYQNTLSKLNRNQICPSEDIHAEMVYAVDLLLMRFDVKNISFELEITPEQILGAIEGKKTSIGYVGSKFYMTNKFGESEQITIKKESSYNLLIKMINDYIDEIHEYFTQGEGEYPHPVFIEVECLKKEVLRYCRIWLDEDPGLDYIEKALNKVRIFYISNVLRVVLDKICFESVSKMFRYYQSAIGVKILDGGYVTLDDILHGTPFSPLYELWEAVYERFPFLRERQYGSGDWSGYDQRLLASILSLVAGICVPFFSNTDDPVVSAVLIDFIYNVAIKTLYIYATNTHYEVFGCMFSGKWITSSGDTVYQMIVFQTYVNRLIEKYPNDPVLEAVVSSNMLTFFFFGDDHKGGWPKYMNKYKLYSDSQNIFNDFQNFCERVAGFEVKQAENQLVDDTPFSSLYFESKGDIIVENRNHPDRRMGIKFLQYYSADIYLDENFIGTYPYRDTCDMVARMTSSPEASRYAETILCKFISSGYLALGNLEFYSQVSQAYIKFSEWYPPPDKDDWNFYLSLKKGGTERRAGLGESPFPDLMEVLERHDFGRSLGLGFTGYDAFSEKRHSEGLYSPYPVKLPTSAPPEGPIEIKMGSLKKVNPSHLKIDVEL
jgi:hypothetical protein